MRTAIVGAGSLGTIIGAFIAKGGKQVDLFDAFQDNVDALNKIRRHRHRRNRTERPGEGVHPSADDRRLRPRLCVDEADQ